MSRKDKSIETESRLVDVCPGVGGQYKPGEEWGVIVNGYEVSLQGNENVELGEMSDIQSAMGL